MPRLFCNYFTAFIAAIILLGAAPEATAQAGWTIATSPTTQDLWGVVYGPPFVAVGAGGTILTSPDSQTWTQQISGTTNWLLAVAANPLGGFLVVGDVGTILSSPNGVAWTQVSSGGPRLNGLACGNGLYLAVGESGSIKRSVDGINWSAGNADVSGWLRGIVFAGGRFLISGQGGTLLSTVDGINFSSLQSGTTNDIEALAYADGCYLAVGTNGYAGSSADGITWVGETTPGTSHLRGVATFGISAEAAGTTGSIYGTNLESISWITATSSLGSDFYAAAASPFVYAGVMAAVAVGQGGAIATFQYESGTIEVQPPLDTIYDATIPGLVDESFNPNLSLTPATYAPPGGSGGVALQANGQIVIAANPVIRLNPDGSWDQTFHAPRLPFPTPQFVLVQSDQKIIITGSDLLYDEGYTITARLNPDGTIDSSYTPHSTTYNYPGNVGVFSDDAIPQVQLNDGDFITLYSGNIQRLTNNGAIDVDYTPISFPFDSFSGFSGLDPMGRVLAYEINGQQTKIVRLNPDGTLDTTFNPPVLPVAANTFFFQVNGMIVYEGETQVTSASSSLVVGRLNADGTADGTYAGFTLSNSNEWNIGPTIEAADDSLLLELSIRTPADNLPIGSPTYLPLIAGAYRQGLIRIDADGNFDPSFSLNFDAASTLYIDLVNARNGMLMQPDGRILIWGGFTYFNGENHPRFVRINPSAGDNFPYLSNISARGTVGPGSSDLVVGFVVDSSSSVSTLLRGIGPGLTEFGISNFLPDPVLTYSGGSGATTAVNQGWTGGGQTAAIEAADLQLGAFALSPGTADSALLIPVGDGSSSFSVTSASGAAGIALAEAYDADSVPPSYGGSRIVNLSCRNISGSGSAALTVGFVVGGSNAKEVFLRALGPSLGQFGISGALSDPILTIYSGDTPIAQGTVGMTSSLEQLAQLVGAFLIPTGTNDSALSILLSPGPYTAVVSSASGATGAAQLEVYEVP